MLGVSMAGPYSSEGSIDDARELASNLGIRFEVLPISEIVDGFCNAFRCVSRTG